MLIHNYPLKYFFYTVLLNFTHSLLTTEVLKDALFQVILSCLFSRQIFFKSVMTWVEAQGAFCICMGPANERWRYTVTPSVIGWVHTQNNPWRHMSTPASVTEVKSCPLPKGHYGDQRFCKMLLSPAFAVMILRMQGMPFLYLTHWPQGEVAVILN